MDTKPLELPEVGARSQIRDRDRDSAPKDSLEDGESAVATRQATYQPMVLVFMAVACGIASDRWLPLPLTAYWISCLLAVVVAWWLGRSGQTRSASLAVLLLVSGVFASWHQLHWRWYKSNEIGRYAGGVATPCCVQLDVVSEPRRVMRQRRAFSGDAEMEVETRWLANAVALRDESDWKPVSGRVQLVVHGQREDLPSQGSVIVYGKLAGLSPPTNPGQFDFANYARNKRQRVVVHAFHPEAVVVQPPAGGSRVKLNSALSQLRQSLDAIIWRHVGEEQAAFASAILLGNREQLTTDRRNVFVETGTVHLLAISGLHVGILAGLFLAALRLSWFRRHACLCLTIAFVVFYAWLVEFRSPATRASILIVLFCLGRAIGEKTFSLNLLALAACLVLALKPGDLFSIGPQLSFLAVGTLVIGKDFIFRRPDRDPLQRLIDRTRNGPVRLIRWMGQQLKTAFLVSAMIWLVALPLVASQFHLVSPIGLLINPFLLIPIAMALYCGLMLMIFGWSAPPLAAVAGWGCEASLASVESCVRIAHAVDWGHTWTTGPPMWAVILFYVGAAVFAAYPPTRLGRRWLLSLLLSWFLLGWWLPASLSIKASADELTCTFIDVGHGTSVLVQTPEGHCCLYDGGSFGSAEFGARNIAGVLWHAGVTRIDTLIVSHADVDHFNALPRLLQQFEVGQVLISYPMLLSDSPSVDRLLAAVQQRGIVVRLSQTNDCWQADSKTRFQILSPDRLGYLQNDNADSLIVKVEMDGQTVLLPGDSELGGLDDLLNQAETSIDLLMAPHHGSSHSRPTELVRWCNPKVVVISGGQQRVTDAMANQFASDQSKPVVLRTDQQGAIRVRLSSDTIQWEHWLSGRWQWAE